MKETKFKTLMYCGVYVNTSQLNKGIYSTSVPHIYHQNDTIDGIIERGKLMKDLTGACFISDSYFENLKQCQLVDIVIEVVPTETKLSQELIQNQ